MAGGKVKARPIQMNAETVEFCKKEINDLLEKKLIRNSKSPWSCSAFYVQKNAEIEWDIFLFELWFDIYDFRQSDYVLTLIHIIFISIVSLISNKGLLQIYFNTEYMIYIYMLE